jgi:hypothetical protein
MQRKFEAEVQQLDDQSYVRLAGVIDEDNDLGSLSGHVRGHTVIVDLAGITEINNCGVRDWVRWLEGVQSKAQVVLVECSPALVAKLNLVSNFTGEAYLRSVYLPYFCQPCNAEKALLVPMDELPRDGPVTAPVCRCDSCDGVMAFDDLEESYFAFVETAKRDIPDELMQLLESIAPAAGERKILSRIGGSSFAGIPSTRSGTGGGSDLRKGTVTSTSGGTGTSRSSAAALRRLREKTSLRTHRLVIDDLPDEASTTRRRRNRKWLIGFAVAATLLGIGLAVVVALY